MPVYTYRCENCGVQFDRTQKFTDPHLTWCPECGKKSLRKVFTPVGIVFKGSGFYATDNRSPSGAGRTTSSYAEDKKADSAPVTKSESAAPSESKTADSSKSESSAPKESSKTTTDK